MMSDKQTNETEVGILAAIIVVLVALVIACATVAVGLRFGAAWGWTVMAAFALLALVRSLVVFKRIVKRDETRSGDD